MGYRYSIILFCSGNVKNIFISLSCLTCVGVGGEGESAVLDIKGEGVDVQSAGADHSDRAVVIDHAIRMDVYIRHKGGCVLSNAVGWQKEKKIHHI